MKKVQSQWSKLKSTYSKKIKLLEAKIAKLQISHKSIKSALASIVKQFSSKVGLKSRRRAA